MMWGAANSAGTEQTKNRREEFLNVSFFYSVTHQFENEWNVEFTHLYFLIISIYHDYYDHVTAHIKWAYNKSWTSEIHLTYSEFTVFSVALSHTSDTF